MGYSNNGSETNNTISDNAVYYGHTSKNTSISVSDTWWMQVINNAGMNLLVNNSYSGDWVTHKGIERSVQLHDNTGNEEDINPDIIAVYLGVNDFNGEVSLDTFEEAYSTMVEGMTNKYNNAQSGTSCDIFLFTLVPNKYRINDEELVKYNNIIKFIGKQYGCTIVDLYSNSGITAENCTSYTYSSEAQALHPNAYGMDLITDCFWNVLYNKYVTNAN